MLLLEPYIYVPLSMGRHTLRGSSDPGPTLSHTASRACPALAIVPQPALILISGDVKNLIMLL